MQIKINELVEALDIQSEFLQFFIDSKTGEIMTLTKEEIEEKDPLAQKLLKEKRYLPLPKDLDKKQIILEFTKDIEDEELRGSSEAGIDEAEAFARFNVAAHFYQIENRWLPFVEEKLRKVAREFCEKHKLPFVEGESTADWL